MGNPGPIPPPNVVAVPAADIQAPPPNPATVVHESYPLLQSEEDANEILVRVRGSTLRRVRKRLGSLKYEGFPWSEVLLGLATLSFGGSLGALASKLPWAAVESERVTPTFSAIFFYVLLPIVGAAAAVAFFMRRYHTRVQAATVATELLEDLPDPERTK